MSRHRNVRSMNYSDEYDGYDDVYGHSVEDDYSLSPSEAGFIYDRTRQPQMSAFLDKENDIQEEDEECDREFQKPKLNDLDEARLRSCLEEIHSVIGDTVPQSILEETILTHNFDVAVSLDKILNGTESQTKKETTEPPKPQRDFTRRKDRGNKRIIEGNLSETTNASTDESPVIKIVPPCGNVVKGFEVTTKDDETKVPSNFNSPRCQSPCSGRGTPNTDPDEGDAGEKRLKSAETTSGTIKTPLRTREKIDAETQYKQDRGQSKDQLHMVVIGHVDAGKSTLMGHLLFALGQINKRTMHKYEQESKKIGKQSFLYAWILDETGEERSRGITMDVGQSKFETKTKTVTLLDAPGHKDFIPNMITGATQADVALLVVDATRGEFETGFESGGQTREHALLVRSLGVNQLAVVVNKLDTVNWAESRFQEITKKLGAFLKQVGFRESDVTYVPCSGLAGQNLVEKPTEENLLSWYLGPTLIEVIENFTSPERPISKPFRMSINDIYKGTGSGFCVSGRVETGMVQIGDKSLVMPQNEIALVKGITIDDISVQTAYAGDQISVTLANYDMENINVGYILCDSANPVPTTTKFEARIVVFNISVPITQGYPVVLHSQSLSEQAIITKLVAQLHKSTGEVVKRRPRCLVKNSNAVVNIETTRPICLELYRDIKELGRFMLRVGGVSIAAGLVTKIF